MRKFTLFLMTLFFTIGTMAQEQIQLTFDRTGTTANTVTVNVLDGEGNPIDGVSATVESNKDFKPTTSNVTNEILCPNVNATANPTIELTFTITGLSANFGFQQVGLDIHALNGGSGYQAHNDNKVRQWNVVATANGADFGELSNVDIAAGVNPSGGRHQVWNIDKSEAVSAGNPLVLKLTITKGTTNEGCFFGLSKVILPKVEMSVEPEQPEVVAVSGAYTLRQVTAAELMQKTVSTKIAIKNLSGIHPYWFARTEHHEMFSESVVFSWEPVVEGTAGEYRIKNHVGDYLQSAEGTNVTITFGALETAMVFKAVTPSASGANELNFNGDASSQDYINGNSDPFLVRFTNSDMTSWMNSQQRTQAPWINNAGKGGFTIQYAYEATPVAEYTANITDAQFTVFCAPTNVVLPEDATAYVVDGLKENGVNLNLVEVSGILPANTGVLLYSETPVECKLQATADESTATIDHNDLLGTINDSYVKKASTSSYYVLARVDGKVGMYNPMLGDDNTKFKAYANKAYLVLPVTQSTATFYHLGWGETTAVESVKLTENANIVYDMSGRRVVKPLSAGVYIINGKKVMVK